MPWMVTEGQLRAQIDKLDADTREIDAALASLGDRVPGGTRAGWAAWYGTAGNPQGPPPTFAPVAATGYLGWSALARANAGDWFVTSYGDQAAAYADTVKGWQAIVDAIAAGQAAPLIPVDATSDDAANANLMVPGLNGAGGSVILPLAIGAAVALAVVMVLRR